MKTSNYILLSFLIFLFGGIVLLFVGAKNYESNNKDSLLTQEKPLESFSVVVAEPGAVFTVNNGKEDKIVQEYRKKSDVTSFAIRNDTLYVYGIKNENSRNDNFKRIPNLFCKNLKSILAKEKANVYLKDFENDSLRVILNKAYLNGNIKKITSVTVVAKEAFVWLDGEGIDKLALEVDKTELNFHLKNKIKSVSGNLKNHSNSSVDLNGKVSLNVDETSSMRAIN